MYKCKYCKKEFKKEELDIHEFNCVSSYGNENLLENLIPCEVCNELIQFDNYNDHISHCSISRQSRFYIQPYTFDTESIENFLNNITQTLNLRPNVERNNEENIEEDLEENIEEDLEENIEEDLEQNIEGDNNNNQENIEVNININSNIQQIRNNISLINSILNTRNLTNRENNYESLSELDNNNVKIGIDVSKISTEIICNNPETCCICFEDFDKNSKLRKLNCNHILCNECSIEWFSENVKCPICMEELR